MKDFQSSFGGNWKCAILRYKTSTTDIQDIKSLSVPFFTRILTDNQRLK